MAKVSVIIPAYNCEAFIGETLDSLINQTLKDIEVIIINDGSTDGTQNIIDDYVKKYDIFKSYIQENSGVSAARNNGLEKATGEYVVFLDADDYYTEKSLEAFYDKAKQTGADLVLGRLMTFGEESVSKYNAFADKLASMESVNTFDITLLWSFLVGNKCYNREKLISSGVRFPCFKYSEEGAFFMSFVYTGAKISGTMDSCMCYRRHTKSQGLSVSQTVSAELAESFSGSLNMIYEGALGVIDSAPDEIDKEEYIQEVIYKDAYILLSQFYRLLWHGDDECMLYCKNEFERLKALMTEKRFNHFLSSDSDLHLENMFSTKKEIAENPNISVIVGDFKNASTDETAEFFSSLYSQISPMFEVIVPKSLFESEKFPEEYKNMENMVVLDNSDFFKVAKITAKAKKVIIFKRPTKLDIRDFRMIYRVHQIPDSLKNKFFSVMIKGINFLLVKKIVK